MVGRACGASGAMVRGVGCDLGVLGATGGSGVGKKQIGGWS